MREPGLMAEIARHRENGRSGMKVIVADKISERGVQLLKEQAGMAPAGDEGRGKLR